MDVNDPKMNALLQLLGNQAAEKVMSELIAGLSPDERKELVFESMRRWNPTVDSYSPVTKEMSEQFAAAMKERRDDIKQMMLAKVDALKGKWIDEQMSKWVRGY